MTRYHHKHKEHGTPAPARSKLLKKKSPKKPPPRYRVERHWPGWHASRCVFEAHWGLVAQCRTLAEAKHQMTKPARGKYPWSSEPIAVRIIDTTDGSIVHQETLHP